MEDELRLYNFKFKEIKEIERSIIKCQLDEMSMSCPNICINGDIKPLGYKSNNIEDYIISNQDKIKYLILKKKKLEADIAYIESLVNTLKEIEREVIKLKYFDNLTEDKIAIKIERERGTVFTIKERALLKLNKIYIK